MELKDHAVWIPKLGRINLAENLRFTGKITGARITNTSDWWFISIQVEMPDAPPVKREASVGIDVGLHRLATDAVRERNTKTKSSSKQHGNRYARRINASTAENWD